MKRSPAGLQTRQMLPGVHKVRAKLVGGVAEYWYAWRGGPRILAVKAKTAADLDRLVTGAAAAAATKYTALVAPPAPEDFISGLVAKYLASSDHAKLADRTKADLQRHFNAVRQGVGTMPLAALKADGARKALLAWRDGYQEHPRTADGHMGALALVLSWAKERGDIPTNPLERWPRLYSVDRAESIWTKADLVNLLTGADPDFRRAVLLAAFTGLRLGDLVRVTWADVGEHAITLATGKSKGRRVALIPIIPQTRAILAQIGRKDVGAVLTHSRGKPWTGWGIQTAMQRAKTDRKIQGLRFHDLRGTAATRFIRAGLPLADVASIMGWAPDRIEAIARRYVTSEAVAAGMLERLKKNKRGAGL